MQYKVLIFCYCDKSVICLVYGGPGVKVPIKDTAD